MTADDDATLSRQDRILEAALAVLADRDPADATLQSIAEAAGVSIGLIQHHFGSKDALLAAVDTYALTAVAAAMAAPVSTSPAEAVVELGGRVNTLLNERVSVLDYLARSMVAGTPSGTAFFDTLVAVITAQWQQVAEDGGGDPDLDVTWAALNPLILTVGGILLRRQIDRHLPEPLTTRGQLQRWEAAVNRLLTRGQIPH